MNAFFEKLKKPSEMICVVTYLLAAFLCFLYGIGNYGPSFLTVIGNTLSISIFVALWGVIPLFLLLKKHKMAGISFYLLAAYWILSSVIAVLDDMVAGGFDAISTAVCVFDLFVALVLIAFVVLYSFAVVRKIAKLKFLAMCVFAGGLVIYLIRGGLMLGLYGKYSAPWNMFVDAINQNWVMPVAIFFGMIAFMYNIKAEIKYEWTETPAITEKTKKKGKAQDAAQEEVPELVPDETSLEK